MRRRPLCFVLLFCCLIAKPAPVAWADIQRIPSREIFSMGYDRLSATIKSGNPVKWSMTIAPRTVSGGAGDTVNALWAVLSETQLSGVFQQLPENEGWLELAARSGGQPVASFAQMRKEGRVGLNLNGEWISAAQNEQAQAIALLSLDEMSEALLQLDYSQFKIGETPFVTPFYHYAKRLWELASPYSRDNNGLSVSSGATGHGSSYSIDTEALRSILNTWADELSADAFAVGLPGTELTLGLDSDVFDAFAARMKVFAGEAEVATPLKFNMAFGEGDVLRNAKGSGTIRSGGKQTGVSYSYTCSLSSTRITRKYSVDFQPKQADTLLLNMTLLTSSNNKSSGADEVTINASGVFDGKPYKLKLHSSFVNKYDLFDDGLLIETITGDVTGSLVYDGQTVAEFTVVRDCQTQSAVAKRAISIRDDYDATITNGVGTLFAGRVSLSFDTDETPESSPDMTETRFIESMDFMELETLRDALSETKLSLLAALTSGAVRTLLGKQ